MAKWDALNWARQPEAAAGFIVAGIVER